tara:strand:+ start:8933 stop:9082 length:150 start_codon:yes stop_codon:yes gene_type:complete
MDDWKKWAIVAGGVVAAVGQFYGGPGMSPDLYLPLIGGAVAAVVALIPN